MLLLSHTLPPHQQGPRVLAGGYPLKSCKVLALLKEQENTKTEGKTKQRHQDITKILKFWVPTARANLKEAQLSQINIKSHTKGFLPKFLRPDIAYPGFNRILKDILKNKEKKQSEETDKYQNIRTKLSYYTDLEFIRQRIQK